MIIYICVTYMYVCVCWPLLTICRETPAPSSAEANRRRVRNLHCNWNKMKWRLKMIRPRRFTSFIWKGYAWLRSAILRLYAVSVLSVHAYPGLNSDWSFGPLGWTMLSVVQGSFDGSFGGEGVRSACIVWARAQRAHCAAQEERPLTKLLVVMRSLTYSTQGYSRILKDTQGYSRILAHTSNQAMKQASWQASKHSNSLRICWLHVIFIHSFFSQAQAPIGWAQNREDMPMAKGEKLSIPWNAFFKHKVEETWLEINESAFQICTFRHLSTHGVNAPLWHGTSLQEVEEQAKLPHPSDASNFHRFWLQ